MKYRKQIYLGYDATGKQIRKWVSADSKTELKEKILKCKMEREKVENPSEITFQKFSEHWFATFKKNRSRQTRDACQIHLNHCSELDPFPIKKITKSMCQRVVNDVWDRPHTAKGVSDVLKQVFRTAIEDGIIIKSPAEHLSRPKLPPSKFHLPTEEELDAVSRADLEDNDRLFVMIMQVFGLRPGEALALMPKDFDFKNKLLHITKNLELPNSGPGQLKSTKTEMTRDIPIPKELIPSLRERIRAISGFYLFEKRTGGLHTKTSYRRLSERIHKAFNEVAIQDKLKALDRITPAKETLIRSQDYFPELTPYSFRHRRATDLYYLCQKGSISTKQAAALMGHSEAVFLKTYSHIDDTKENLNEIYPELKSVNW